MSGFYNSNELSHTEPERNVHAVRDFLNRCGVNTSNFPYIRFLIETSEKEIRSGRQYIPLRIPTEPGVVFDTIIRITRVLEVPAVTGAGHRKFLELEWEIDEHAIPEDAIHEAIQFLGHEVMCPKCRELFNPDPEVLDRYSIQIECSQCLFEWIIRATAVEAPEGRVPLLLDLLRADPASMRRYLIQWDRNPIEPTNSLYFSYFPFQFEHWTEQSSLDLLFGEDKGLTALSNGIGNDFELLAKGLLNQISLEYFKQSEFSAPIQGLDKTEIRRKEETVTSYDDMPENTPIVRVTPIQDRPAQITHLNGAETNSEMRWNISAPIPPVSRNLFALNKMAFLSLGIAALVFIYHVLSANIQNLPIAAKTQSVAAIVPANSETPKEASDETKLLDSALASAKAKIRERQEIEEKKEAQRAAKKVQIVREDETKTSAPTPVVKSNALDERLKTERVETFYRQGMLHLKLQQSKEAEVEFQQVITLDPKHAAAYRGLGLAYVYDQKFSEAISAFENYLKVTTDHFDKDSIEELIQTLRDRSLSSNESVAKQ